LTVTDDGCGFEPGKQKKKGGLMRMRERASSINARLAIDSGVGKGTTITVTIDR